MSSAAKRVKHVPKHRQSRRSRSLARQAPRTVVRNTVLLSGVAVAATGVAVANGMNAVAPLSSTAAQLGSSGSRPLSQPVDQAELDDRAEVVSRSDSRDRTDESKRDALSQEEGQALTRTESLDGADPREIGRALLPEYGFSSDQFGCLDALFVSESDWDVHADNPTSSAYGIPQALTSTYDVPAGYYDSAEVQIRWGLDYIRDSYGSPCSAWAFKQANGWY